MSSLWDLHFSDWLVYGDCKTQAFRLWWNIECGFGTPPPSPQCVLRSLLPYPDCAGVWMGSWRQIDLMFHLTSSLQDVFQAELYVWARERALILELSVNLNLSLCILSIIHHHLRPLSTGFWLMCVHILLGRGKARQVNQPSHGSDSLGNTALLGRLAWWSLRHSVSLCLSHWGSFASLIYHPYILIHISWTLLMDLLMDQTDCYGLLKTHACVCPTFPNW